MLKLFEKSAVFQVVVILVVTILLWLPHLTDPQPMVPAIGHAPLYSMLYNCSFSPLFSVILAIVLIIVGGIHLNLMLANTGLISQSSLFPTLFYILFMSATAETLSPILIVGILIIAFVRMTLIHSTPLTITSNKIFGATAIIGICSLFYLPSLILLLSYLTVAVSYRLYGWRDWMVALLGLLAPYIPLWAILYLNDTLTESFSAMGAALTPPQFSGLEFQFSMSLTANIVLILFFVISLFILWRSFGEKTTLWQKNAIAVVLPTVAALALIVYNPSLPLNLQLFAIPFSLCATLRFTTTRFYNTFGYHRHQWKSHLKDLLFLIVIASAILC